MSQRDGTQKRLQAVACHHCKETAVQAKLRVVIRENNARKGKEARVVTWMQPHHEAEPEASFGVETLAKLIK